MQPDSPLKVVVMVVSRRLLFTGWISKPNRWPCFHAHETWNSFGQSVHLITAPSTSPHKQHFFAKELERVQGEAQRTYCDPAMPRDSAQTFDQA